MAEGGGLLNRYTGQNLYRGFESLSLRQKIRYQTKCRRLSMRLANLSLLFLMTSSIFQFHVSEFREDANQDPITNEMIEEIRGSSSSLLYKASCGENNCDGKRDITRGATQGRSTDRSSCRRQHWEVRFWFVAGDHSGSDEHAFLDSPHPPCSHGDAGGRGQQHIRL